MITVLVHYERISLFHTMEPFFLKKFRKYFLFTQSADFCLNKDINRILFMERWFKNDLPPDLELMKKLRDKYKTIVFLDGYAGTGTHLLEILPFVDRLFHKSVLTEPELYTTELYAKRYFAQYYHDKYDINDSHPEYQADLKLSIEDTKRIELSWNIGVGDYPRRHKPQRIGVGIAKYISPDMGRLFRTGSSCIPADFASGRRTVDVHSRFGLVSSEAVAYQRKIYLEKIKNDKRFITGSVPQDRYYSELEDSKIVFSPFGWGEVCFRDFEAVISGAMLLKPDMSHQRTWPDIYIPYETYVPVDWDGNDLLDKADKYLSNDTERIRIAENCWIQYRNELNRLEDRFESLFQNIMEL